MKYDTIKLLLINTVIVFSFFCGYPVQAVELPGPLVDSEWLAENREQVVILDVRQDLKSFSSKPVYMRMKNTGKLKLVKVGGHIPGAILVDFKSLLARRNIDSHEVSRIIPLKADFENLMQQYGLNQDNVIIIVSKGQDSSDLTMATRLYWQLKYYGHDDMAILNGGMSDWLANMHSISLQAVNKNKKGNWLAKVERKQLLATTEDVEMALANEHIQLVDNRTLDQYLGIQKRSYVYSKGHISGAKVLPHNLLATSSKPSRFLSNGRLGKVISALNINTDLSAITYCNSGHLASGGWFILSELLGNQDVKLYDGSMHEWTMDDNHPVTTMKME